MTELKWTRFAIVLAILYVLSGPEGHPMVPPLTAALVLLLILTTRRGRRLLWSLFVGAIRAMRALLRRRGRRPAEITAILSLSSYGFELFCRDLLEDHGFQAIATKATGDQGVDVELRAKDGERGIAQCKQWRDTKVGRPTIQQLYGEMISRGAPFGYVITTSGFTREAREWARTKRITLVDRDGLLRMTRERGRRR